MAAGDFSRLTHMKLKACNDTYEVYGDSARRVRLAQAEKGLVIQPQRSLLSRDQFVKGAELAKLNTK